MMQAKTLIIAVCYLSISTNAYANSNLCENFYEEAKRKLNTTYREFLVSESTSDNGDTIRTFVNRTIRTWTMVYTTPEDQTCLLAQGTNYKGSVAPLTSNQLKE
jgi:hypothetical protein